MNARSDAGKAVVLAAGRGSRMRGDGGDATAAHDGAEGAPAEAAQQRRPARTGPEEASLDPEQRRWADEGRKPLIPFHGHPFLSYGLSALADAGIREVCLVVGPGDDPVRARYRSRPTERIRLSFAVQERPTGSADALLAAEAFAGGDPVVVLNGDNLYPAAVLERLRGLPGDGLVAFRAGALAAGGNIPRRRVAAFAVVAAGKDGCLRTLIEKPTPEALSAFGSDPLVSMTCWRFTPAIFMACRAVAPSPRGEHELPDAVMARVRAGACVRVLPVEAGVLDLTRRSDIPAVAARLRGREVRL